MDEKWRAPHLWLSFPLPHLREWSDVDKSPGKEQAPLGKAGGPMICWHGHWSFLRRPGAFLTHQDNYKDVFVVSISFPTNSQREKCQPEFGPF